MELDKWVSKTVGGKENEVSVVGCAVRNPIQPSLRNLIHTCLHGCHAPGHRL